MIATTILTKKIVVSKSTQLPLRLALALNPIIFQPKRGGEDNLILFISAGMTNLNVLVVTSASMLDDDATEIMTVLIIQMNKTAVIIGHIKL